MSYSEACKASYLPKKFLLEADTPIIKKIAKSSPPTQASHSEACKASHLPKKIPLEIDTPMLKEVAREPAQP